jgi:hypothetical protein
MATIGINFGRFNPPHIGHIKMWESLINDNDFAYIGHNPNTVNSDNPLPADEKETVIKTLCPIIKQLYQSSTLLTLASQAYSDTKLLNEPLELNVYSDEDWLITAIRLYNNNENMHGYFKFDTINQVKTERITSSTAVKEAVTNDDREAFTFASGFDADTLIQINTKGIKFFDLVREHMKT